MCLFIFPKAQEKTPAPPHKAQQDRQCLRFPTAAASHAKTGCLSMISNSVSPETWIQTSTPSQNVTPKTQRISYFILFHGYFLGGKNKKTHPVMP